MIAEHAPGPAISSDNTVTTSKSFAQRAQNQYADSGAANRELAGMNTVLETLREGLSWPLQYPEQALQLGVRWPKGVLLHGPSGCGKTAAVYAVARECNAVVHLVTAASIVGAYTGESERRLRETFDAATKEADSGQAVVVFLDEIDALCPRRSASRQHEARIVGQLLTLLDGTVALSSQPQLTADGRHGQAIGRILVVGATSRPNAVDPALRRPGRLEREVVVTVPDAPARASILRLLTQRLPLDGSVDMQQLALETHGYTGADLRALCREAAMCAIAAGEAAAWSMPGNELQLPRVEPRFGALHMVGIAPTQVNQAGLALQRVTAYDFSAAMKRVGPSMARGSTVEYEPVSWDDIGGLENVKKRLKQAVEWPLRHANAFQRLGLHPPRGVLLYGPPGCSKTTLARAAATASGATFIALSGAQLYSMYVGEGEALLRETFRRARLVAPCIVFFDELDSLVGKRVEGEQTSEVAARILSSFLTEMDGLELAQGVLVMGATNRPQALDAALLRPGRFDAVLYVPPPDELGRFQALQIHTRSMPLAANVDLKVIAAATDCYTETFFSPGVLERRLAAGRMYVPSCCAGAELAAICREAAMAALREGVHTASEVHLRHFADVLREIKPQLTAAELLRYENWGTVNM